MPPKKVILRVPPQPTMPQLPTDSKKSTSRVRARRVEQSAISPDTALSRAVTLQNEIINARTVPSSQSSEISPSATRFLGMLPEDDFMDDYPMTSVPGDEDGTKERLGPGVTSFLGYTRGLEDVESDGSTASAENADAPSPTPGDASPTPGDAPPAPGDASPTPGDAPPTPVDAPPTPGSPSLPQGDASPTPGDPTRNSASLPRGDASPPGGDASPMQVEPFDDEEMVPGSVEQEDAPGSEEESDGEQVVTVSRRRLDSIIRYIRQTSEDLQHMADDLEYDSVNLPQRRGRGRKHM